MVEGINWTTFVVESSSSTDWTTVLVALATGLTAVTGPVLLHALQLRQERRATRAALFAEVAALAALIRTRRYCEHLQDAIDQLAKGGGSSPLQLAIPQDYNLIYRQNAGKLGCLEPGDATSVVRFYQEIMEAFADMSPGGALFDGTQDPSSYADDIALIESALAIADELARRG